MVEIWDVTLPALTGDEKRRAYVYLPKASEHNRRLRFPVLYMFDGHNVFFDEHATYGKSWGLGNYLDAHHTPLIVAAVECNHDPDNGRLNEYAPYPFSSKEFGDIEGLGPLTMDWLINSFKPEIDRKDFAATIPYLFCPGNHDSRGLANRHLERIWMYRQPEERKPRDWDLGRNFAVRMGDIALVGLDTGEDKLDTNQKFCNLFVSEPYRVAQQTWLRDALKQPEIASAPYLVAFCHIPLFDPNPKANPGDVYPDDKDEKYQTNFAMWQRTCAKLWGLLLEEAGCQLLITAHQHCVRFDKPNEVHKWFQIVGGGPNMTGKSEGHFPTVIEGEIRDGKLVVTVHNIYTGNVCGTVTFGNPR